MYSVCVLFLDFCVNMFMLSFIMWHYANSLTLVELYQVLVQIADKLKDRRYFNCYT